MLCIAIVGCLVLSLLVALHVAVLCVHRSCWIARLPDVVLYACTLQLKGGESHTVISAHLVGVVPHLLLVAARVPAAARHHHER